MALYPVNLNISGRLCLVVGGGAVAARKIESLLLGGAVVRVVSPELCGSLTRLAEQGRIDWLPRPFRDEDVADAFLVFAATDRAEVQAQVGRQAVTKGVLLNSADNPGASDFHVPAAIRRGKLLFTVSTGGGSPALAAQLRERIDREFGPEYGVLVELLSLLRQRVVDGGRSPAENQALFYRLLELPVLDCIRECRWEDLRKQLAAVVPASVDSAALVAAVRGESGR